MKHFTSTARRDSRWWVVQCDQEPGALSQVARLEQAVEHQREAIAMITGLDESKFDVEVKAELDETLELALSIARDQRTQAESLNREASDMVVSVAQTLASGGSSMRDIGFILGVSHQRVAQLLNGAPSGKPANAAVALSKGFPRTQQAVAKVSGRQTL